ncbi:MAG: S16 family serine protease [Nitrososphaerota archaeon]|nr:AAA family ATPase [Candidatus Bathyarchaeota archaeon]MDW8022511.1 S16 family serine protease [Nitrososphaerota archaeon]
MSVDYFGKDFEVIERKVNGKNVRVAWDWKNFESTKGFPVDDSLINWVIGQDQALKECFLCLDEWVHKLKHLEQNRWYESWSSPDKPKSSAKTLISPGPYLLLLGDPGTGKSLIGRALAEKLTQIYKENGIKLFDVLCWKNPVLPSQPKISIHEAGVGKKIIQKEQLKELKRKFVTKVGLKVLQIFLILMGLLLMSVGFYLMYQAWQTWNENPLFLGESIREYYGHNFQEYFIKKFVDIVPITFIPGGSLIFFGVFIWWFSRFSGSAVLKGIGGAQQSDVPKLIVDNSSGHAPFVDATGHRSAQLFGSIAWDPYQTGGLGTPEHQRVTAGDVHRASMGILFIDEIKNLDPEDAVTLLTVLEEGQLPVTLRSRWHGGDTAAMAVATEPVPAVTFLVGAGNFDSINQIHPALMDRIYGYGKVVRMNNDMPNTVENRRKYVQFIAQEVKRFNLIPFSREACEEIVEEGRRRSNKKDALTTRFRPLISIIKTAATLAMNEGCKVVERRHVREAIENHCKTIQRQILEHEISERGKLLEIKPEGVKLGQIYGLAVVRDPYSGEMTGSVLCVKAHMVKRSELPRNYPIKGYYKVTGVAKGQSFIADSIAKVRSVILQKYGIDIAQDYLTHIDFAQSYGVDGPSAGVTMAILLCSLIEGKPIRQDVAVTGEINLGVGDKIQVTAVGGVYEKIKAAEAWGFKKVVIPHKNFEHSIDVRDYKIEVVPAATLDDYLKECLVEKPELTVQMEPRKKPKF